MTQQYHFTLPQHEAMGLEDFLPSPSNEEAVRWLLQTAPAQWSSHAFVLSGAAGSGKTHLLSIWSAQQGAQRVTLGDPVLAAIVKGKTPAPAFALDNADACAGNPAHEEWLQHFYNATKAANLPVLLTAETPVAQWGLTLRDIETRLKSGAAASLLPPDDELMRGLLLKQFRDRQLLVEAGVVDYLAARLERTSEAVRCGVSLLDEAALAGGRKISIPFAQKILDLSN
ncbi:MAG TPA: chromosomal replication initiator DnaA [Rhodospirillaceae bacterium]|nr:chromosomal replication initiator DnaA [Rhodospirillaceae bacterium]